MICPDCKGEGLEEIFVHGGLRMISCLRCNGFKEVPDAMADWIIRGRAMRDRRVHGKPYRTMLEEAKRLGITCLQLSRMENGKIEPRED